MMPFLNADVLAQKYGNDPTQKKLTNWLQFYNDSGLGVNRVGSANAGSFTGADNLAAMNWAQDQLDRETNQQNMVANRPHDFFGGGQNGGQGGYGGGYQPAQYAAPQNQAGANPMGSDVTNYLRQLLNGQQGRNGMQRNFTQVVRG